MSSARSRAPVVLVIAAIVAAAVVIAAIRRGPARLIRPANRPALLLLTSLPIVFGQEFALTGAGSPAVERLKARYRVLPISVTNGSELAKGGLLLMAQPPAQTPENLVALDDWVRRGGRVLLLADPLLDWPSERPLGDPLRQPPMFMDTGLLAHWGLRLDAPDKREPAARKLGGYEVMTVSPGKLVGRCQITADRLVAYCRIGEGRAAVIADADLLDVSRLGSGAEHNLDGLLGELARVDSR